MWITQDEGGLVVGHNHPRKEGSCWLISFKQDIKSKDWVNQTYDLRTQ